MSYLTPLEIEIVEEFQYLDLIEMDKVTALDDMILSKVGPRLDKLEHCYNYYGNLNI